MLFLSQIIKLSFNPNAKLTATFFIDHNLSTPFTLFAVSLVRFRPRSIQEPPLVVERREESVEGLQVAEWLVEWRVVELLVEGLLESSLVFSLKMSPFYIKILFFSLNPRSPVFFLAHPHFLLSIFLSISCSVLLPSKLLILYKYLSISVRLLYCFMFNQRSPSQPPPLQGGGVLSHVSH